MIKEGERDEEELRGADERRAETVIQTGNFIRNLFIISLSPPNCSQQEDTVVIPM